MDSDTDDELLPEMTVAPGHSGSSAAASDGDPKSVIGIAGCEWGVGAGACLLQSLLRIFFLQDFFTGVGDGVLRKALAFCIQARTKVRLLGRYKRQDDELQLPSERQRVLQSGNPQNRGIATSTRPKTLKPTGRMNVQVRVHSNMKDTESNSQLI